MQIQTQTQAQEVRAYAILCVSIREPVYLREHARREALKLGVHRQIVPIQRRVLYLQDKKAGKNTVGTRDSVKRDLRIWQKRHFDTSSDTQIHLQIERG